LAVIHRHGNSGGGQTTAHGKHTFCARRWTAKRSPCAVHTTTKGAIGLACWDPDLRSGDTYIDGPCTFVMRARPRSADLLSAGPPVAGPSASRLAGAAHPSIQWLPAPNLRSRIAPVSNEPYALARTACRSHHYDLDGPPSSNSCPRRPTAIQLRLFFEHPRAVASTARRTSPGSVHTSASPSFLSKVNAAGRASLDNR